MQTKEERFDRRETGDDLHNEKIALSNKIMNSWKSSLKLANDQKSNASYVLIGCIRQVNDVLDVSSNE